MESICQCQFNDIMSNELIEGNALIKGTVDEITDFLSNSNLDVLQCYKDIFRKEYFIKNVGGYIFIFIIVSEIVLVIIFFIDSIPKIFKYIYNLTEYFLVYNDNQKILKDKNDNKISKKEISSPSKKDEKKEKNIKNKNLPKNNDNIKKRSSISIKKLDNRIEISSRTRKSDAILNSIKSKVLLKNKSKKDVKINNFIQKTSLNSLYNKSEKRKDFDIDMEEYLKQDYDDMDFEDALKNDNRTFYEFFCDRIKENQIIMNTFFYKEDLKPISIKMILLLLNINLYFVINGLFLVKII